MKQLNRAVYESEEEPEDSELSLPESLSQTCSRCWAARIPGRALTMPRFFWARSAARWYVAIRFSSLSLESVFDNHFSMNLFLVASKVDRWVAGLGIVSLTAGSQHTRGCVGSAGLRVSRKIPRTGTASSVAEAGRGVGSEEAGQVGSLGPASEQVGDDGCCSSSSCC